MEQNPKITSKEEIQNIRQQLSDVGDLTKQLMLSLNKIKISIQLGLSPTCSELGKKADFMVDVKDKIIPNKVFGLVNLFNTIKEFDSKMTTSRADFERDVMADKKEQN